MLDRFSDSQELINMENYAKGRETKLFFIITKSKEIPDFQRILPVLIETRQN